MEARGDVTGSKLLTLAVLTALLASIAICPRSRRCYSQPCIGFRVCVHCQRPARHPLFNAWIPRVALYKSSRRWRWMGKMI